MTQSNNIQANYTAGIKMSPKTDAATVVLLQGRDEDIRVVGCQTMACSGRLTEIRDWLKKQAGGAPVTAAAGVDSSVLRFLDMQLPSVDPAMQYPLIQTQAEAMLPLSSDQTLLAWRTEENAQGLLCRTAAVRKELLRGVLAQSEWIATIAPDAVGLAAAWNHLTHQKQECCFLMLPREHDFLVALLQDGRLLCSAVIDAGEADFQDQTPAELLLQDISTELDAMQTHCEQSPPLLILSENKQDDFLRTLCSRILDRGRQAEIVQLKNHSEQFCKIEATEALGLALAAAGDKPVDYDFRQAEALNQPQQSAGNTNTWLRNAIAVTVALMVAALAASYWSMKKDVKLLGEVIAAKHEDLTVQQVLSEQAYREKVARARPDLADLIDRIQQARGDILLDTLEFEKGKPVKISAVANSYDSAYTMQKNLESQNKGVISKVLLVQPRLDQKGKVNFSITFHYRNFSQ
ncbi:MAG: hypothetical protein ACYSOP_06780 [Planctomycetota bacterium]